MNEPHLTSLEILKNWKTLIQKISKPKTHLKNNIVGFYGDKNSKYVVQKCFKRWCANWMKYLNLLKREVRYIVKTTKVTFWTNIKRNVRLKSWRPDGGPWKNIDRCDESARPCAEERWYSQHDVQER